jgi:hypothetical protein
MQMLCGSLWELGPQELTLDNAITVTSKFSFFSDPAILCLLSVSKKVWQAFYF